MAFSAADHAHMARALQLARRGLYTTRPNPRVGCVIVRDGEIVGEGWHRRAGGPHAEVLALRAAGGRARGATVYVTLEPCSHHGRTPPCADALVAAGVARVVAALRDPNPQVAGGGLARLAAAGITVEEGLLADPARRLNAGFVKRMERGLPWVRVKLAASLDGRTALASGESQWITGPPARRDVQHWRARSDAILTGRGTVAHDDPSLNLRLTPAELGCDAPPPPPLRVVLDSRLQTPPAARLFRLPGPVLLVHDKAVPPSARLRALPGVDFLPVPRGPDGLDLRAVLTGLARREVNEVQVEAGATLDGAPLAGGLVDELVLYLAPHLLGDGGRGLFHLPHLTTMADRIPLRIGDITAVGDDWRIIATPEPA